MATTIEREINEGCRVKAIREWNRILQKVKRFKMKHGIEKRVWLSMRHKDWVYFSETIPDLVKAFTDNVGNFIEETDGSVFDEGFYSITGMAKEIDTIERELILKTEGLTIDEVLLSNVDVGSELPYPNKSLSTRWYMYNSEWIPRTKREAKLYLANHHVPPMLTKKSALQINKILTEAGFPACRFYLSNTGRHCFLHNNLGFRTYLQQKFHLSADGKSTARSPVAVVEVAEGLDILPARVVEGINDLIERGFRFKIEDTTAGRWLRDLIRPKRLSSVVKPSGVGRALSTASVMLIIANRHLDPDQQAFVNEYVPARSSKYSLIRTDIKKVICYILDGKGGVDVVMRGTLD